MKVIRVMAVAAVLALCVMALSTEKVEATEYCWLLTDGATGVYSYMKLGTMFYGDNITTAASRTYFKAAGVVAQVFTSYPFIVNKQVAHGTMALFSATRLDITLEMSDIENYNGIQWGPQLNETDLHMMLSPTTFSGTYTRITTTNTSVGSSQEKRFDGVATRVNCN